MHVGECGGGVGGGIDRCKQANGSGEVGMVQGFRQFPGLAGVDVVLMVPRKESERRRAVF